jgi:DNA polymerase-3 subunit epsilon
MLRGYNHRDSHIDEARAASQKWARELLADPASFVILDTETTGFTSIDEIIQIGVIDGNGTVLINNQLIKPTCPWGAEAEEVHRITERMVAGAPTFDVFFPELKQAINDRHVVIYNASYDTRLLSQSLRPYSQDLVLAASCAMLQYARYVGEWNSRRGQFKWQKLPSGDHSAVGDCLAVLKIIRQMAGDDNQNL